MSNPDGLLKKKKSYIAENRDHLRFALIYCLEGVILGQDKKSRIQESYLGIVEDFDAFNKYPWGQESYLLTMSFLRKELKPKSINYYQERENKDKSSKSSYTLQGFPYSLQVSCS